MSRAAVLLPVAILVAASLHFILIGAHAQESPLVAAGFLAAAVIQMLQASLIAIQPWRPLLRSVIFVNVLLIGLYLGNVFIGLPLPNGPEGRLVAGEPETIDAYGLLTIASEAL